MMMAVAVIKNATTAGQTRLDSLSSNMQQEPAGETAVFAMVFGICFSVMRNEFHPRASPLHVTGH